MRHHDQSATQPQQGLAERELLTAAEAAHELRVARRFVYQHARELGGWRLLGERGPWRFARQELLAARPAPPARVSSGRSGAPRARAREQTHTPSGVAILPSEPRHEAP